MPGFCLYLPTYLPLPWCFSEPLCQPQFLHWTDRTPYYNLPFTTVLFSCPIVQLTTPPPATFLLLVSFCFHYLARSLVGQHCTAQPIPTLCFRSVLPLLWTPPSLQHTGTPAVLEGRTYYLGLLPVAAPFSLPCNLQT